MIPDRPWHPLTFADLRRENVARCYASFHALEDWSPTDWGTALAGEVGEALNLIKKMRRGEPVDRCAVAGELADAQIYLDLLAARLGIDLGRAVAYKFNRTSERRGARQMLHPDPPYPCRMGSFLPVDDGADGATSEASGASFRCPRCGKVSHHPSDKQHGYCARCCDVTAPPGGGS